MTFENIVLNLNSTSYHERQKRANEAGVLIVDQQHTSKIARITTKAEINNYLQNPYNCDGIFLDTFRLNCGVLTADCLPILIQDPATSQHCILHCGVKGIINGIIESAISMFSANKLIVYVGPHIHRSNYNIQEDFIETIEKTNQVFMKCIKIQGQFTTFGVLKSAILVFEKYKNIQFDYHISNINTYNSSLPSYRRNSQDNNRILSFIKF